MSLKIGYLYATGQFDKAARDIYEPIAKAGSAAMRAAAAQAKEGGRAEIAAAGFSARWQNTLRADVYPKRKDSANAAAHIWHKIPYAAVFDEGETIRGRPSLFVPLPGTPKKIARKKMTAGLFAQKIGPLFPLPTKGTRPLLAANMAVSKAAAKRGAPFKPSLPALRRGAAGQGIIRAVPLFIGLDKVRIPKKFNVTGAVEKAAANLPELYLKNLKDV